MEHLFWTCNKLIIDDCTQKAKHSQVVLSHCDGISTRTFIGQAYYHIQFTNELNNLAKIITSLKFIEKIQVQKA